MNSEELRLTELLRIIRIPSNRTLIQNYFYNFNLIVNTLQQIFCQPTETSKHTLDPIYFKPILALKQTNNFFPLAGALIIRLLFIDYHQQKIVNERKRKVFRNTNFTLLETFGEELLTLASSSVKGKDVLKLSQWIDMIEKELNLQQGRGKREEQLQIVFHELDYRCIYECKVALQRQIQEKIIFDMTISQNISQKYFELFVLYQEMKKKLNKVLSETTIKDIFEDIYLTLGSILFFETICNRSEPAMEKYLSREDSKAMVEFKTHAFINKFHLLLKLGPSQGQKLQNYLNIEISFQQNDVNFVQVEHFYKYQNDIRTQLEKMKENLNVHLFISSMVYSINHNQVIGSGSFGTIFKAKALKLHRTEECGDKAERLKLIFSKKKMALKKLKEDTKGYVKKGYKVDQKRELLILQLLKELKFEEEVKRAKRKLGLETQRDLIGLEYLITLQETCKIASLGPKPTANECSHMTLLVFQKAQTTLSDKDIFSSVTSRASIQKLTYYIYRQLFEGLFCLHSDINHFYNHLLKKYFVEQDKKEENQQKAQINQNQRCGIYHRDIKPHNIVIDFESPIESHLESIRIRIIDFGMAGIANFQAYRTTTNCGSAHFMAPQIKKAYNYDEKVDIWSAGVVLFEHLVKGNRLYGNQDSSKLQITKELIERQFQKLQNQVEQSQWVSIVRSCLTIEQETRKSSFQILKMLDQNKLKLMHQYDSIIDSFFNSEQYGITAVKTKTLQHEYDEFTIQIISSKQEKGEQLIISCYSFQQFIKNYSIPLKTKIPIVLSFLSIFIHHDLLAAISHTEVLFYQKTEKQYKHLYVFFKNRQKGVLAPRKGDEKKRTQEFVQKTNISEEFLVVRQTFKDGESTQTLLKLILNFDKKYIFQFDNLSYLFSGYNIGSTHHNKYRRSLYELKNNRYEEYCSSWALLTSSELADLHYGKEISVYWLKPEKFDVLTLKTIIRTFFHFFKAIPRLNEGLKVEQCRIFSETEAEIKKNLLLVALIEIKKQKLHIKILQDELDLISNMFFEEPSAVFSEESKGFARQTLEIFAEDSRQLPYPYFFKLSLLLFANSKEEYLKILKHGQKGEKVMAIINQILVKVAYVASSLAVENKKIMYIKLFLEEFTSVAMDFQDKMMRKFKIKSVEIPPQLRYHPRERYSSLKNLFSIIRAAYRFQKQVPGISPFLKILEHYKHFFLILQLFKLLFNLPEDKEDLCLSEWISSIRS